MRLHEKGGTRHDVPAHHRAAEALDAYLEASGLEDGLEALFQSVDRVGDRLTGRPLTRRVVLAMIKRRAAAGLPPSTCCHAFRATGAQRTCRPVRTSRTRNVLPSLSPDAKMTQAATDFKE